MCFDKLIDGGYIMNFNKIVLLVAIMLVVLGMGTVVAEDISIGDYEFSIPDGFQVVNSTDNVVFLSQDDDHAIGVIIPEAVKNSEDAKIYLESQGYTFIGEETYDADGKEVQQQNYESDGYTIMAYVIPAGDDQCVITYTIPSSETPPEGADNPVTTILNSIH